jgi:hypothetical protein
MSAVAEKEKKPAAPMGSFLAKLTPKEKADESGKTEKPAVHADAVAEVADKAEPVPAKADAKAEGDSGKPAQAAGETEDKAQLEKRLKDTQSWANELNKKFLKLEKENRELRAIAVRTEQKIDGTYEEPKAPSTEQLTYDAEMRGKIRASHRAAVRKHGEEFVMNQVWLPDSPYQKLQDANPLVTQRVMASDDPVQEALDILQEEEDAKKYGRTSEEMKRKIEEELKPKITQEILAGLKSKPGLAVATLGNARGEADRTSMKADVPAKLDLAKVFPHGASRR